MYSGIEARAAGLSGSDGGIWCFKVEDGEDGVQFNRRSIQYTYNGEGHI